MKAPLLLVLKSFFYRWGIEVLMVMGVFACNFPYLFVDYLIHDDGLWYWWASEGKGLMSILWRGKPSLAQPFRDILYAYGMVHLGLPVTRAFFVLLMSAISVLLFQMYRKQFGLPLFISVTAALLPNILPGLCGIPAGLNASYAMWGLLPMLISGMLIFRFSTDIQPVKRNGYIWAILFYTGGILMVISSTFLMPVVLCMFFFAIPAHRYNTLRLVLPFVLLACVQLFFHRRYTHMEPTIVPFDEMAERALRFFSMSDFSAAPISWSPYLIITLCLLGLWGLLSERIVIFSVPQPFAHIPGAYRIMITGWTLCWIACNSIPYIAFTPNFRPYDYAYVFNFGTLLLATAGIYTLATIALMPFGRNGNLKMPILMAVALLLILFTGYQRIRHNCHYPTETSTAIRSALTLDTLPGETQVVILDIKTESPGHIQVNTGYLRYILGRNDVKGLIGNEIFPADIYAEHQGWHHLFAGMIPGKPIAVYRNTEDGLTPLSFFLRVIPPNRTDSLPAVWEIYHIHKNAPPEVLVSDSGFVSLYAFLSDSAAKNIHCMNTAFLPEIFDNRPVSVAEKDSILQTENLLHHPVAGDELFVFKHLTATIIEDKRYLQGLIEVKKPSFAEVSLCARAGSSTVKIPLFNYCSPGDHLLFFIPIRSKQNKSEALKVSFHNQYNWSQPVPLHQQGLPPADYFLVTFKGNGGH